MRTLAGWSTSSILAGMGLMLAIFSMPSLTAAQSYVFSSASFPTGLRPIFVATGDYNGDGIRDVVVVNQCGSDPTCSSSGSISVLLGKPDGTFQSRVDYPVGSDPTMGRGKCIVSNQEQLTAKSNKLRQGRRCVLSLQVLKSCLASRSCGDGCQREKLRFQFHQSKNAARADWGRPKLECTPGH